MALILRRHHGLAMSAQRPRAGATYHCRGSRLARRPRAAAAHSLLSSSATVAYRRPVIAARTIPLAIELPGWPQALRRRSACPRQVACCGRGRSCSARFAAFLLANCGARRSARSQTCNRARAGMEPSGFRDRVCPEAALRAVPERLLLSCLQRRTSWLTVESDRRVDAAGVLHRRGGRAAVAVSVNVADGARKQRRWRVQRTRSRRLPV